MPALWWSQIPLLALQELARHHREKFVCPVIGITGSNGKTIVKEWLFHCLSDNFVITRSPKSYNSQVGVALSVWLMDDNTQLGIFEAGISLPGEMKNLRADDQARISAFLPISVKRTRKISAAWRKKCMKNCRLFYDCRALIYCHDHELIRQRIEASPQLKDTRLFILVVHGPGDVRITGVLRENGKHILHGTVRGKIP